jgi:hypothetical protein
MIKSWAGNSPMLNDEIGYAEKELNGRMATHFSVPFSGAHPTIKDLAIDLTYYRTVRLKDPEKAEKFKGAILGRIDDIKSGNEYIYTDSNTTIAPDSTKGNEIWSNMEDYEPTFSMLDVDNPYSQVSSQRQYDEEQARK